MTTVWLLTDKSMSPARNPATSEGPSSATREMKIPWKEKRKKTNKELFDQVCIRLHYRLFFSMILIFHRLAHILISFYAQPIYRITTNRCNSAAKQSHKQVGGFQNRKCIRLSARQPHSSCRMEPSRLLQRRSFPAERLPRAVSGSLSARSQLEL